jgi:hypothetical protein
MEISTVWLSPDAPSCNFDMRETAQNSAATAQSAIPSNKRDPAPANAASFRNGDAFGTLTLCARLPGPRPTHSTEKRDRAPALWVVKCELVRAAPDAG